MQRINVYSNQLSQSKTIKKKVIKILKNEGFTITDINPELIIVIGGDGTMLSSVRKYVDSNTSFLSINTGNLGFLSGLHVEDIDRLPELIKEDKFNKKEYPLLNVFAKTVTKKIIKSYCFNDTIIKNELPRVMEALIYINNQPFNYFTGDGLIISTAIGSTGYAIWANGSAIDHSLDAMQLTPLVPNDARMNRPLKNSIIMPLDTRIDIKILKSYKRAIVSSCDGKNLSNDYIDHISINKSDKNVTILNAYSQEYVTLFKRKIIDKNINRYLED